MPMSENYSPFSSSSSECVTALSETLLIESIQQWLGPVSPESPNGIGDDCAVTDITGESRYLLTTVDGVAWGEHFDASVSPELAGRKLMARNLSDIASMGGIPRRAVISLWMGANVKLDWLRRFYEGIAKLAEEFGVEIVGGDVSRAPRDVFISDLCLQGMCDRPIQRKQVETGDSIWVTGKLGGSILGKHVTFQPRVKEGLWLNENHWAKSMMDISDGLAKDLGSLVGKREVEVFQLPISDDAISSSETSGMDPWVHGLCDGEDYELVFVVDRQMSTDALVAQWNGVFDIPLTQIGVVGEIQEDFSLVLNRGDRKKQVFQKRGYEHF